MAKKKKQRRFKPHAEMDLGDGNKLELMYSSNFERVTVRAVKEGVPQKPYSKSDVFIDEENNVYFLIAGSFDGEEYSYIKMYLSNFTRVRG